MTIAQATGDEEGGGLRRAAEQWWTDVRSGQLSKVPGQQEAVA